MTLFNKTYQELYDHFKSRIEFDNNTKFQEKQTGFTSGTNGIKLIQHQTDKGILEIPPCITFKGQKAYMDGRPAPDGKYILGFLSSIQVHDGIIIKG